MDKESEGRNRDKGAGHEAGRDKPDHERGSDKHQDREKSGRGAERGSGGGEFRQNAGQNREQGSEASGYSQVAESKRDQDAEKSDYHYNQAAEKLAAEEKKSGCLPKLFMLLVPFVALGTYALLKS